MINDLYSSALLDAAASIPPRALLEDASATARKSSKVCGSEVTVSLKMDGDMVSDIGLDVKACALGQASSSMLARSIKGAAAQELRELRDQVVSMLQADGPVPAGDRWAELAKLQPIKDYPARHASTLLVFDAVIACLDQIDGRA